MLEQYYRSMALVVGLLALLLPEPARTLHGQLLSGSIPIALGVVMRWMVQLAAMLATGQPFLSCGNVQDAVTSLLHL